MTFRVCLDNLKAEGAIDKARADRFAALFDQIEAGYKKRYGATPASVLAGEETLRALEWDAQLQRRQGALQVMAQKRVIEDMDSHAGGNDGAAIIAMMARDPSRKAKYRSIEGHAEVLDFQAHAMIEDLLNKHRRNLIGQPRDKAGLYDILRARHGQKVDNPDAQAISDAVGQVFEMQRQRFNLAGGDIGYRADYGITHRHDARRVRKAGYEQWRADIMPLLDREKMVDAKTGGAFTDEGMEEALRAVWEAIRTDGLTGLGESRVGGAKKLANRRSDARFLHFKDGDAWLAYNESYGSSDPFTAIMDQIHGMNRDIAMLERFGPNPQATVDWAIDQAQRRMVQGDDPSPHVLNASAAIPAQVEKIWRIVNGEADIPVLGGAFRSGVVKGLHGARDLLVAAKLGKAALTTVSDLATARAARAFNGIPQTLQLKNYLKLLNPMDKSDRKLAAQLELGMRDASQTLLGLNRYMGQTFGPSLTKTIADTSLRITGLNAITEAGQRQFGKDFLAHLAHVRDDAFEALDAPLRAAMEGYGIGSREWDIMRSAPVHSERGGEWMIARAVREADPDVAEKMMDMVLSETATAVQSATVRGRALTNLGNPGTFAGELGRSVVQFKTFIASLMLTQGMRMSGIGKAQMAGLYGAKLFVALTLMGAATMQLRQLTYGEDLRDMDDWEFWVDAMASGGGMFILGDIIGSFKREGMASGIGEIMTGPLAGAVNDAGKATIGNAFRAARGDETHVLRDLNKFARRNTPGSNTWYAGLAFQRMVFDQLQALADEDADEAFERQINRAEDQGTDFWWAPGDGAPGRAPDLAPTTGANSDEFEGSMLQ